MTLPTGTRLGSHDIVAVLGAGGMGVVYRAYDSRLQRTIAIKVLSDAATDSESRQRLLHEARAASALNHPNICIIHEVGEADGRAFIVMEHVDGRPLGELIPRDGLATDVVLRYAIQVSAALAHAHDRGVIHRDFKSANVMVTTDGRAKVVDFGLARLVTRQSVDMPTSSNVSIATPIGGTLSYMAPEVLKGEAPTIASDLWALGVVLYELASGHLPFTGRTPFDLTASILRGSLPPLPAHVPASLRMVIARCLGKEPHQRYAAAGEVSAALQAVQSDSSASISVPMRSSPRSTSIVTWLVAAGVAIAVAAVGVFSFFSNREARTAAPAQARLRMLVGSERRAFDPALSPDGKMIAYVAQDDSGHLDLFVARVAGGGRVRLTDDAVIEGRPQFSPDGERIVFGRRRSNNQAPELCVVPALGGEIAVVLTGGAQASWSPDGEKLVFTEIADSGTLEGVATVRADGSDRRQLVSRDAMYPFVGSPTWAPDGKTIAVVRSSGGVAGEIWLVSATGENLRRLSRDSASVFSTDPVFTSDGRAVIHASNRGGAINIWSLPLGDGPPVRLTTGPGPDSSPTVARSGDVSFLNSRWRQGLLTYDLASGQTRTLVTHSNFLWGPAFSPDGREIAFSQGEVDGAWHIWLVAAEGGSARQLTSGPLGEVYPRYTSDGQFVIYHTWDAPHRIWRAPRAGGPPVALTPPDLDARFGDVSPDRSTLAFAVTEKDSERVYTLRFGESKPRLLTTSPASVPRWSPDGKWIAYSADRGYGDGVFLVRSDGTGERRLTETGGWPVWWPDGQRISYLTRTGDGRQQIETTNVAFDGGAGRPIPFYFNGTNFPFDFSTIGRTMATSNSVHVLDEIWLLERGDQRDRPE